MADSEGAWQDQIGAPDGRGRGRSGVAELIRTLDHTTPGCLIGWLLPINTSDTVI